METQSSSGKIVLACSGASNLGELSDKVARRLKNNGEYKMKCLSMLVAERNEMVETIKTSETLVIDGCLMDCGRKIMEESWLTDYNYIRLTDLDFINKQTPVNDAIVDKICNQIHGGAYSTIDQQHLSFADSCCDDETCDMFEFMSDHIGIKILHPGGKDATKAMLSALPFHKHMKVLDIACGKGRTSVAIAKKYGCKVVGFDLLENSIQEAKEYAKKQKVEHLVSFVKADAEQMPFGDHEFDITIAQAMLILVNNKEKVLQEAHRVLKPGGIAAWNELSWKQPVDNNFKMEASKSICGKCIANVVTFDKWVDLFKSNGFNQVNLSAYDMQNRGFSKMISDEGFFTAIKIMYKYMTKAHIRARMKNLNQFFKTYPEFLGYGIYFTKK